LDHDGGALDRRYRLSRVDVSAEYGQTLQW
jgi:hypothetical protein